MIDLTELEPDLTTSEPGRGKRLRFPRLLAAALVLVLAGAAVVLLVDDHPATVRTDRATDPTAGWRTISFHGVDVRIPRAWRIGAIECGTPMEDTAVLDVSSVDLCLKRGPEQPVTVVWVARLGEGLRREAEVLATQSTMLDGTLVRRGSGPLPNGGTDAAVLLVPARDVAITVESPDSALATQILDTVRIRDADRNGCPARSAPRAAPPPPSVEAAGATLVPGAPISVLECRYADGWLEGSAPARTGAGLEGLVSLLNALPEGAVEAPPGFDGSCPPSQQGCTQSAPRTFVLTFSYGDGSQLPVDVRIAGPGDIQATNGLRSHRPSAELVFQLVERLGYDWGFPDPRSYG
jgi:hypothetical protein